MFTKEQKERMAVLDAQLQQAITTCDCELMRATMKSMNMLVSEANCTPPIDYFPEDKPVMKNFI